jgi:hypothetical protein
MFSATKILFAAPKKTTCGDSGEVTPKISKNYSRYTEDNATHTNWGLLRMIAASNPTNWGAS